MAAANTASAIPVNDSSLASTAVTNSGSSDIRTPKTTHPVARFDASAAR